MYNATQCMRNNCCEDSRQKLKQLTHNVSELHCVCNVGEECAKVKGRAAWEKRRVQIFSLSFSLNLTRMVFRCFNRNVHKIYGHVVAEPGRQRLLYSYSDSLSLTHSFLLSLSLSLLLTLFSPVYESCARFFCVLFTLLILLRSNVMRSTFVARLQPSRTTNTFSLSLSPSTDLISPSLLNYVSLLQQFTAFFCSEAYFLSCCNVEHSVTLLLSFKLLDKSR